MKRYRLMAAAWLLTLTVLWSLGTAPVQASLAPLAATATATLSPFAALAQSAEALQEEVPTKVEYPRRGLPPVLFVLLLLGLVGYWWLVTGHRGYWQTLLAQQKPQDKAPLPTPERTPESAPAAGGENATQTAQRQAQSD